MPLEEETAEGLLTLFLSAMHGHHERTVFWKQEESSHHEL